MKPLFCAVRVSNAILPFIGIGNKISLKNDIIRSNFTGMRRYPKPTKQVDRVALFRSQDL